MGMIGILLWTGLLTGSIYALMALALSFSYKSSEIANFAQGEMATLTTFVAFVFFYQWDWPFGLALLLSLGLAFGFGFLLDRGLLRRVAERGHLPPVILTLGLQLFLFGLMGEIWGSDPRAFSWPVTAETVWLQAGTLSINGRQISSLALAIGLMLSLGALLRYTSLGLRIKASQQNSLAARLSGIPVDRIRALTFGISALLGGVAGLLVAPIASLDPSMMWDPLVKGFAAAVLGGMRSLRGAIVGGLLLGLAESLVGFYLSLEFKSLLPFLLIVLVLWFRPQGLLERKTPPQI